MGRTVYELAVPTILSVLLEVPCILMEAKQEIKHGLPYVVCTKK